MLRTSAANWCQRLACCSDRLSHSQRPIDWPLPLLQGLAKLPDAPIDGGALRGLISTARVLLVSTYTLQLTVYGMGRCARLGLGQREGASWQALPLPLVPCRMVLAPQPEWWPAQCVCGVLC